MGHRSAPEGHRVLVAAPYGRDAESVAALLARHGYDALVCRSLGEVADRLDQHVGVVLLTEEALASGIDRIVAWANGQPPWSDLPFVVLAAQRTGRTRPQEAVVKRLPEAITNTVVLERPLGSDSLLSTIKSAMRSRQKQFEMRDRMAEIAQSEERQRLATSVANIGTWDYDPVQDRLTFDARSRELFGVSPEAAISYDGTFLRGLHPEDREATEIAVGRALDPCGSGAYDIEYRVVGIDNGVERWLAARGRALFADGQAARFIGTIFDITEAKTAEATLRGSQQALIHETRALDTLNRTGERIAAELDLDRLVQSVVEAATELTGATIGAFFYNQEDEGGESYLLYALSGAPRAAFENFPSPRNTAIFGPTFRGEGPVRSGNITEDPRYGLSDTHWGMPKGHLEVTSYLAVPVVSRNGAVIGGLLFGHPEADRFDARAERLAIGIAAQAAIGIDNARLFDAARRARDTLEQKVVERTAALEQEMANRDRAEAALRQSQKMEAVGQLTGGIAHDFNNMLTGVIGAMDIMKRRLAAGRTDDLPRFMEAATTSAQRAAALTQRLLAFSRRQSLDARAIDVGALLRSLEELLRRSVNESVTFRLIDAASDLPRAVADTNQLENAILNLVINARDAMPNGGQLTVETSVVVLDETYTAARPEVAPGRYVVIAVSDTGVGMPPEVLERVFEPFFSTKPIGQGTGLGLSMVYGFARQSEGQVRIHSRPGEGTSVKLYLPVAAGDVEAAPTPASATALEGRGQTVLLVEDDASVRLLVRDVLEELSYRPIEAASADEALPIILSDTAIDLMVSDVGLPGMSGRQLAEITRQHRPELPILFVTGYAENAAIRAGFLGTGMDMITKPFAIEELSAKIAEMMPA